MNNSSGQEIIIQIDNIDQIFNPPALNPFSNQEVYVLGEAALMRAVRNFLAGGARPKRWARLVFRLPENQITPGLQARLVEAVGRYCQARIKDNRLKIRLSRTQGLIGLGMAITIVIIVGLLSTLLLAATMANTSQTVQGFIVGFFSVFAWVIVWDPMNRLLFNWVPPFLENRILNRMMELEIAVEAQP